MSQKHRKVTLGSKPQILIDPVGGTNPIYVGFSQPGAKSSDPDWRILKLTWDSNNIPVSVYYAESSAGYNYIWDNRATYTYGQDS